MKTLAFDALPRFDQSLTLDKVLGDLEVATAGDRCLIRKADFVALCSLKTGEVSWCVARNAPHGTVDPSRGVYSSLLLWGTKLWIGLKDQVVAEIFYHEQEKAKLVARCMKTGKVLWEYVYRRPPLEPWAEQVPAWPERLKKKRMSSSHSPKTISCYVFIDARVVLGGQLRSSPFWIRRPFNVKLTFTHLSRLLELFVGARCKMDLG